MSAKPIFITIGVVVLAGGVLFFVSQNPGVPKESLTSPEGTEYSPVSKPTADEQYLVFQLFTFSPTPEGKAQPFDKKSVAGVVDEILNKLGGLKGDGKTRQLGFAIGPLALDHTDEELRQTIRESFQIAEEKNVAVAFHIDDSVFWLRRKDLWSDPKNVEWSDWAGTVHPRRFVGWAPTVLAPQMCYTSPSLRKEISRIAKGVIGAEIKKGIDGLKSKNKENLFAGVIAGWETHLADFRYVSKDDENAKRLGIVRERIGYCALSNLGFSAKNPPKNFDAELERVVHDWAEFWAKNIYEADVSKKRIYTHISYPIFPEEGRDEIFRRLEQQFGFKPESELALVHATPKTAFNEYSRPGISTYSDSLNEELKSKIPGFLEELPKHKNPPWASAEGTNTGTGGLATALSWEEYLGGLFGNGAVLVNIFAWQEPPESGSPFGKATKSEEALLAYKKFLKGEELVAEKSESAISQPPASASLPDKIQKIQKELPLWIQKNPSRQAEALLKKLDEYVKANNTTEASKTADEILRVIGK